MAMNKKGVKIFARLASFLPMKIGVLFLKWGGVKIGINTSISRGFYVDRPAGLSIGIGCFLNYGVHSHCGANDTVGISIGNSVFIGSDVRICCSSHEFSSKECRAGKNTYGPVHIKDGCWIGLCSIILPNVTIAEGCVIAAGSVVTKSTEPNGLYAGVPARRIKELT